MDIVQKGDKPIEIETLNKGAGSEKVNSHGKDAGNEEVTYSKEVLRWISSRIQTVEEKAKP